MEVAGRPDTEPIFQTNQLVEIDGTAYREVAIYYDRLMATGEGWSQIQISLPSIEMMRIGRQNKYSMNIVIAAAVAVFFGMMVFMGGITAGDQFSMSIGLPVLAVGIGLFIRYAISFVDSLKIQLSSRIVLIQAAPRLLNEIHNALATAQK